MALENLQRLAAKSNSGRIPAPLAKKLTLAVLNDLFAAVPEHEALYLLAMALDASDPDVAFKLKGLAEIFDRGAQLGQEIARAILPLGGR